MTESVTPNPEKSKPVDFAAIVDKATLILKDPKGCWLAIKAASQEPIDILKKYALPLLVASQLAAYIKTSFIGITIPAFGTFRAPYFSNLIYHVFTLILAVGALFIAAFIFEKLAPKFGGTAKFVDAFKLLVYASTASLLGGILIVVPFLGPLAALAGGIYSIYTIYQGINPITGVPTEKRIAYYIVSLLVTAVVLAIVFMPLSSLFAPVPPMNVDLQKLQENLQRMMPNAN